MTVTFKRQDLIISRRAEGLVIEQPLRYPGLTVAACMMTSHWIGFGYHEEKSPFMPFHFFLQNYGAMTKRRVGVSCIDAVTISYAKLYQVLP